MKQLINIAVLTAIVLLQSCGRSNNSDTMSDTTRNQDTDYKTDTFIPTDSDPRRQRIEDPESSDSLRIQQPPANSPVEN